MRWMAVVLLVLLAACRDEPAPDYGIPNYDPNMLDRQHAACAERGGSFRKSGISGGWVCFQPMPDANEPCATSSDCDGLCLARSKTCTPIMPLIGCHEVVLASGAVVKQCVE